MDGISLDNYNEIVDGYRELQDNDPVTAYELMKRSAIEKEYFDTLVADATKDMIDAERDAKCVEARACDGYRQSGKTVKDAENMASYDSQTVKAWKVYSMCRRVRDSLQAQAGMLERIYFDCKNVFDSAYKKFAKAASQ